MKIFTIYDSKTDAHVFMTAHENEETMKREIIQRMAKGPMDQFAEDYTLFEIAAYDEVTGTITPYSAHRSITNLLGLFPRVSNDGDADKQIDLERAR